MYYPFLRGKQNEILAIKELSSTILKNSTSISPIIEPIKLSPTFKKALPELAKNGTNFNLIINPREGELQYDSDKIITLCSETLENYDNYQIAIIIDDKTSLEKLSGLLTKSKCTKKLTLIHYKSSDDITNIINYLNQNFEIINNVINMEKLRDRYFSNFDKSTIVTLIDSFISQDKNSDYLDVDESDFSEEHLFFENENLKGFADYLTIGDKFMNGGFAPYAVAVHITFIEDNKLRVKHFVSDSNMDTTDVAGKYSEALDKLIHWENTHNLDTLAMDKFRELYNQQHYPGLGVIKKLSLMNHIEVCSRVL